MKITTIPIHWVWDANFNKWRGLTIFGEQYTVGTKHRTEETVIMLKARYDAEYRELLLGAVTVEAEPVKP